MNTKHEPRPELNRPLHLLQLSTRARRAAETAGARTVRDFLLLDKEQFLKLPECGDRTWRELECRVASYLAMRAGDSDALADDARLIAPLLTNPEHARQLADNGIHTVADFLARDRKEAQRIPCLRRSGWMDLLEAVVRSSRQAPSTTPLLPESLRNVPLTRLSVATEALQGLADFGCSTIGHALSLPARVFEPTGALGLGVAHALRQALERLLSPALAAVDAPQAIETCDWPTLRARMLAALDDESRDWFCERVGLLESTTQERSNTKITRDVSERRDQAVRNRLTLRAPSLLQQLRSEYTKELDAFEGVVPADRIAQGTWLHTIGKGSGDEMLPLRLLAFCFPEDARIDGRIVSPVPQRTWHKLRQRIRSLTTKRRLPVTMQDLAHGLAAELPDVSRGVVARLIAEIPSLCIRIEERRGEVVQRAKPKLTRRLEQILVDKGEPTRFLDLVFEHRDRFQTANESALLSRLRRGEEFVQLSDQVWSLARWHRDEIEQLRPDADRICASICESGKRQSVRELHDGEDRARWIVSGLVRRDPRVRWLGRGEACPANLPRSRVLEQLLKDFRRAAGEVPMSRFLDNQPGEKKRVVERLLRSNRLFVFPAPDRIDLLTNYPFNEDRLRRLATLVDDFLSARNGYAPLDAVLEEVNRCDLGGSWLHITLLGELLRRHGPFEILPGGFVARRSVGLVGWLMRRARSALRDAAIPLTVAEMLAKRPELAEFAPCLEELLAHDPLVQSPDGNRYQIA